MVRCCASVPCRRPSTLTVSSRVTPPTQLVTDAFVEQLASCLHASTSSSGASRGPPSRGSDGHKAAELRRGALLVTEAMSQLPSLLVAKRVRPTAFTGGGAALRFLTAWVGRCAHRTRSCLICCPGWQWGCLPKQVTSEHGSPSLCAIPCGRCCLAARRVQLGPWPRRTILRHCKPSWWPMWFRSAVYCCKTGRRCRST